MTRPVVATLGVFDGVHRGHRHIFRRVVRRARRLAGTSLVYTFDPHPARVLVPQASPPMLMTLRQKREAIRGCGLDRVLVQRFTRSFARMPPDLFFDNIIRKRLKAREIFVGYDFTFGYHRSGTAERLETMGKKAGIRVTVVEPYLWRETLVSSTQIRQLLGRGRVRAARELLGRRYAVEGRVVKGRGIGGTELGIHTANLAPENEPILPTGVYASYTTVGSRRYASVTNIGPNPTFGPGPLSLETHLLHFNRSILGRRIRIEFEEKIREEIAFASARDLAAQIRNDIRTALKYLRR